MFFDFNLTLISSLQCINEYISLIFVLILNLVFINANNETNVRSILHVSNTIGSSSPTNGSVIIDGGLGISDEEKQQLLEEMEKLQSK